MSVPETIRVGIIGCGGNGRWHLRSYLAMEGVQVVGLADPDQTARAAAWELTGNSPAVKTFASHGPLLRRTEPEAVLISTPHVDHHQQILDSLAAGCHVLCEKPLVCTVQQAREVIRAAQKAKRVLGISYQRHTMPHYLYVRGALQEGLIGRVLFVSCLQSQNWLEATRGTWRQDPVLSCGGQLNDSGSHLLDIVLWMTGLEPESVFAFQDNCGSQVDILTAMSVRAQGGALLNFSVVAQARHFLEEITIWGETGTIAIRGSEVLHWNQEGPGRKVTKRQMPPQRYSDPDANFVAALRGQDEIAAPPDCGLQVIRLTEAAWRSAASGKPVAVK